MKVFSLQVPFRESLLTFLLTLSAQIVSTTRRLPSTPILNRREYV